MKLLNLTNSLERSPIIAAINDSCWNQALDSSAEVIFYLKANLITVEKKISEAHSRGKHIFIHLDLTEGIGKDRTGIEYLKNLGADGIVSTRNQLIRSAHDFGMITIQRFFTLDSQGISSINESVEFSKPDMIEIMPGVIPKTIRKFVNHNIPVIAGGLIETKEEITEALKCGATAVSTGKSDLWES